MLASSILLIPRQALINLRSAFELHPRQNALSLTGQPWGAKGISFTPWTPSLIGRGNSGVGEAFDMAQPLHSSGVDFSRLGLNKRDIVMLHSGSVQNYISTSEDRELMLFSAWLLACALLLEEDFQQLRPHQA